MDGFQADRYDPTYDSNTAQTPRQEVERLKAEYSDYRLLKLLRHLTRMAENVSGAELPYAEVAVTFCGDDTLAESALDDSNGWSAGETWAFEVQHPGIGEDAAPITDYEIRPGPSL